MSTRNLPGGKGLPARKANNPTAICKPIVAHVARMGRRGMHRGLLWENQKERDRQENLHVDVRIILKFVLEKQDVILKTGFA
jgi:hypothetical protein